MAVETMKKINIIACRSDRKSILELIQSKGFVEISGSTEDEVFHFEDTSEQLRQFERNLSVLSTAIYIMDEIHPEKKPFYLDAETISGEDSALIRKKEGDILKKARQLSRLSEKITQSKADIENLRLQILGLKLWSGFDFPLNCCETKKTAIYIGSISGYNDETALNEKFRHFTDIPLHTEIISSGKEQTCFFVIAHRDDISALQSTLNEMGFVRASMESQTRTPIESADMLEKQIQELNAEIEQSGSEITALCSDKRDFQILYDSFISRTDKYEVIGKLRQTNRVFVLNGYIPEESSDYLSGVLENKYTCCVELTDPDEDDDIPVKLKNNWFAAPVQGIVESFSLPSKDDIDPTFIMSIFYYFYFGMMFSDAGYGLMVMIVCGLLGFVVKNVKPDLKNSMRMFFFCGVSTFIWGMLYGSFFGNAVSVIATGFFNSDVELKPILFDPVKDPLTLMIVSIAMGILHILTAYVLKFITIWRTGKKWDAVCDAGFWLLLLLGISILAVWMVTEIEAVKICSLVLIAIGAGGTILMSGRANKNIILRLLSGVISLYDLTGFLSDALSYSRLMALGLATGVVATVANLMGSLFGFAFPGSILFWVVSIAFHLVNFAINMLGAYVHTNRLQYVEFFSKFYEGGGRKFEPFSRKYKYTKMKEND